MTTQTKVPSHAEIQEIAAKAIGLAVTSGVHIDGEILIEQRELAKILSNAGNALVEEDLRKTTINISDSVMNYLARVRCKDGSKVPNGVNGKRNVAAFKVATVRDNIGEFLSLTIRTRKDTKQLREALADFRLQHASPAPRQLPAPAQKAKSTAVVVQVAQPQQAAPVKSVEQLERENVTSIASQVRALYPACEPYLSALVNVIANSLKDRVIYNGRVRCCTADDFRAFGVPLLIKPAVHRSAMEQHRHMLAAKSGGAVQVEPWSNTAVVTRKAIMWIPDSEVESYTSSLAQQNEDLEAQNAELVKDLAGLRLLIQQAGMRSAA